MTRLLATLLICLPLIANAQWTAKNLGGRSLPVYRDAGDLVAFSFPLPNQRVSFLTHPTSGSVAGKYPNIYWWCSQNGAFAYIEQVDGGAVVTVTGTVTPSGWSNANGQLATGQLAGFNSAANSPKHIGFSFGGGCFYDTGVGISSGSSEFHLLSFTVQ